MTSLLQTVEEEQEVDLRSSIEQAIDQFFMTGIFPDQSAFGETNDIIAFLESEAAEAFFSSYAHGENDERIVALYQWLSTHFFDDEEVDEAVAQYAALSSVADSQIGDAFANVLLNHLPVELKSFPQLQDLPMYRDNRFEYLMSDSSVVAAGEVGKTLAHWRLTPAVIASAMRSISNLAYRRWLDWKLPEHASIAIASKRSMAPDRFTIDFDEIVSEVSSSTELEKDVAVKLSIWIVDVSSFATAVFDGFIVSPEDGYITLTRTKMKFGSVHEKWNFIEPALELQHA